MPRFTHSLHPPVSTADSTLTQTTFHAKQFVVIFLAVRFSSIDIEALGTDRSATVTAHKMFRMKSFTNGLYTRPRDRLLASIAVRSKVFVVILFTIQFSTLLYEALVLKRLTTSITHEMFWVPRLSNRTYKRTKDFLPTGITERGSSLFDWLC